MFEDRSVTDKSVSSVSEVVVVEEGGFGKIEPALRPEVDEEIEVEEDEETEFISSRKLRRGRISSREMRDLAAFKRYESGEPSSRLYIKNIAKQTTEKELRHIFGRYINWDSDIERNMFDIRLMKEGRMKGQAFVSLATADRANEALKETHGFELNDKPIVVTFARSSKPKEPEAKTKK